MTINSPRISLLADTPIKKILRNQMGPGRYHGFLRYLLRGKSVVFMAFITELFSKLLILEKQFKFNRNSHNENF